VRSVYGRTTGVGANRHVDILGDLGGHALRLLRSHAGGLGEPLADDVVRATILVRLAQMAAGGGSRPEVAVALAGVLAQSRVPTVRDLGGLGTGDLTVLAQLGLALAGEGEDGEPQRLAIAPGDALPLMSSNAATFGTAALVWADLCELLDAGIGIAALSFQALQGNREAFASAVAAARPLPGLTPASSRPRGGRTHSACVACRRSPARCTMRSPDCTTCSRWRSTPRPRTRCSRVGRRCTTADSTRRAARSRSTACGWRSCRSAAWRARGSRT
jgi:histidine ammonia-lyase